MIPFLAVDLVFLGANLTKILQGGVAPLLIAGAMIVVMRGWMRGTALLEEKAQQSDVPLKVILDNLGKKPPALVQGTGVYLTAQPDLAPVALMHML